MPRSSVPIPVFPSMPSLLLQLWPIAAALRDAVAVAIQAEGDLIASALLVVALLLTLGLIRIVFAFGRRPGKAKR
jgi:hypothetical protein